MGFAVWVRFVQGDGEEEASPGWGVKGGEQNRRENGGRKGEG